MTPYYSDDTCTIYHGDCREVMTPDLHASLVVTDPPYGETSLEWDFWPRDWPNAVPTTVHQMWCFGSMRMLLAHYQQFALWRYAQEVVWEKHNGSGFHADRFKRVHEFATHWYRGSWADLDVFPQMTNDATKRQVRRKGRPAHTGHIDASAYRSEDGGPKLQRSVIYVRSMHGSALHPTEKPIGILEPLILYSTNHGDTVLDPFMGSGSTLDAARQNGRKAIGIEAAERYCEVAAKRLSAGVLDFGGVA